ncbi:hypothetical protein ACFW04_011276 [Cataglyphis niger]
MRNTFHMEIYDIKKKIDQLAFYDSLHKYSIFCRIYRYSECRSRRLFSRETRRDLKRNNRSARGIRGHVEAYVAAFDKHWNLALEDCFESGSRKVKRKAPALGADAVKVEAAENGIPKTVVRKERKTETLERHVPQMLLRGEQVAIIVKIN